LLRHAGSAEQRAAILPKVADGSLLLAFAHTERQARYDLADVGASAKRDGAAYLISAEKSIVLNGDSADKLVVSARVAGKNRDRDGIALFLVDATAPGVTRRGYQTIDGLRAADISLAQVKVGPEAVLGKPGEALPLIERVVDEAIAAMAAEPNDKERRKAIAATKVQIGRSGRLVGQQAVQLHGGIGMTMEYKVGHYFKRVTAIDTLFGDADHHLGVLSRSDGLVPSLS